MSTLPRLAGAVCLFLVCAVSVRAAQPPAPPAAAIDLQNAFAAIAASLEPAVVSIDTTFKETEEPYMFGNPDQLFRHFFGEPGERNPEGSEPEPAPRHKEGLGSGVIIDARGYILTNEHVVGGAEQIRVILRDPEKRTYVGKVVGTDPTTDLAVVKIEPDHKLSYAGFDDSDKVRIGDWSIAIGSPFGLGQTVTVGVISGQRQSMEVENRVYSDFLQTDAAINMGNSGGPLVDIEGRIIGINTAIFSPSGGSAGIGFAIPSNEAKLIAEELIAQGRVIRSYIGVEATAVDRVVARQFKVPGSQGALVNSVLAGSPAEKAGIKRGDVIVRFDGKAVADQVQLAKIVGETPPKTTVTIQLIRDGKPMTVSLTTVEKPAKLPGAKAEAPAGQAWHGARLEDASPELNGRYDLPADAQGAVVVGVEPGSDAEEMGLEEGDLVRSINRQKVSDVSSFLEAAAKINLSQGVVLDVQRKDQRLYLSFSTQAEAP